MTEMIRMFIPSECVPAVIGHRGQKHRDIEMRTGTRVKISSHSEFVHSVTITGELANCKLAETLTNMAVGHNLMSLKTVPCPDSVPNVDDAKLDVKTFFFEVLRNKN